jgi:hypothetical protein
MYKRNQSFCQFVAAKFRKIKLNFVELLHFLHFHHVSLVQWTKHLLPAPGGSGCNQHFVTGITCWCGLAAMPSFRFCKTFPFLSVKP